MPIWAFAAVAGTMWFPAVSAYIIRRWVTRAGFGDAGIRIGPWRAYLVVYVSVPLAFLAVYLLSWLLGTARLDPSLSSWLAQVRAVVGPAFPTEAIPKPRVLLAIVLVASLSFSPLQHIPLHVRGGVRLDRIPSAQALAPREVAGGDPLQPDLGLVARADHRERLQLIRGIPLPGSL